MPTYEYKCNSCGQVFEVRQRFSDSPLTQHEACGGGPVERLLSAPALQFKGSGWYITDYARGGGNKPASGSSESKSGDTKSDAKPAPSTTSTSTTSSDKK